MPSSSKSQQRFFGVVKAMQKGDIPKKGEAGKAAKSMDKDDVDDFASTKHKGLPNKVKRESRVRSLIRKMVREIMAENTVRISTFKDATFHRDIVQLLGKKGKVSLDKKSVSALVKIIRSGQPGTGMGRSFTTFDGYDPKQKNEAKLNEAKTHRLPNGVKVKVEFKGITLKGRHNPVFLDRSEMMRFFKATHKYLKTKRLESNKVKEGFAGGLPKSKRKAFDNIRRKQSEVLGYKLTGKDDMKVETDDATVKEGKLNESQQVAKTILQQLGGNRFIAMTGAKNFGSSKNSLQFKIGRNSKSISHVIITLKSSDLYDVEFIRMRGVNRKVVKKLKGVYADQLGTMFKKYTGMNVRL